MSVNGIIPFSSVYATNNSSADGIVSIRYGIEQ